MIYNLIAGVRHRLDGWKTVIFHGLTTLPSAAYALYLEFQTVDITPLIPLKYAAMTIAILGVIGVVIRIFTDNAIGVKGPALQAAPDDLKEGL